MGTAIKFANALREIRVHLCQKTTSSAGVRDFIEKHYVDLKKNNPKFPILIRECSAVEPKLWVRYEKGKEKSVNLANKKAAEILQELETLNR